MSINNTVITPQTAAATYEFKIVEGTQVSISADNLAGAEVVDVLIGQGATGSLSYTATGLQLTATAPFLQLEAPGTFQVSKVLTAGACGVFIDGDFDNA